MAAKIAEVLRRAKKIVKTSFAKDSWHKKIFMLQHDFTKEIVKTNEGITLKILSLDIASNKYEYLLDSYQLLKIIKYHLSAKFYIKNDLFFIEFEGKRFNVTTAEEVLIIVEIFISGTYNFSIPNPTVVIDIGMNVGFASIFFASKTNVVKVFSFEPFELTYNQAKINFTANQEYAKKVKFYNVGLGGKDESLVVKYNYENKGQVGVYGTSLIKSTIAEPLKVTITLKDASAEILKIINQLPDNYFALKVDCEGAEYEIFKNLANNDVLQYFSTIMIEWHEKGPEDLLILLEKAGFSFFHQQSVNKRVGMIYASR